MSAAPLSHSNASRRTALLAAALGVSVWLAGCAAFKPKTPEEVVAERAQQRWDALVAGNFDQAWTYTQPGYRAVVKQQDYKQQFGSAAQWKGAQIQEVTCEADRCTVGLRLTSKVLLPNFRRMPDLQGFIKETWVRDEGQWWFYQAL